MKNLSPGERILLAPDDLPGTPEGYELLYRFVVELYDEGAIPWTETTEELAAAFMKILRGEDPLDALRLKRRRGHKVGAGSAANEAKAHGAVWNFIGDKLDASQPHAIRPARGALEKAIQAACTRFHKERRTIQRSWARFAPAYDSMRRFRWTASLMGRHLADSERQALGALPARVGIVIAIARQKGQRLAKSFEGEVAAAVKFCERRRSNRGI